MQKVIRSSGSDYVVSSSSDLKSSKPQYKKFLSKDCSGCSGYFLCSSGHSPKQLKWRTWKPTVGWNITVTGELNTACQWMKGNTKLQTLFQRKGLQGAPGFEPTLVGAVSLSGMHTRCPHRLEGVILGAEHLLGVRNSREQRKRQQPGS